MSGRLKAYRSADGYLPHRGKAGKTGQEKSSNQRKGIKSGLRCYRSPFVTGFQSGLKRRYIQVFGATLQAAQPLKGFSEGQPEYTKVTDTVT
jgi:hypothetical protein